MKVCVVLVLVPALAHAEPRIVGVADAGTAPEVGWYAGRYDVHAGGEGDIEVPAAPYLWLGGGLDVQHVWYADDECYGFHGWQGDAYASATLDLLESTSPELHVLLGARAGLAALRRTPDCVGLPHPVARNDAGYDLGGMFAIAGARWRIQVVVDHPFLGLQNEPTEVTVGFGYVLDDIGARSR